MVWRNNPAGVDEQGRYRRGLIRNLGDLIAPPYERTATGGQCGGQIRSWPFGTTDLAQKEIATAITNGKSGRVVLLTVLKAEGWRLRSLSTLILLMRQGNHPEGPCVRKGVYRDHRTVA